VRTPLNREIAGDGNVARGGICMRHKENRSNRLQNLVCAGVCQWYCQHDIPTLSPGADGNGGMEEARMQTISLAHADLALQHRLGSGGQFFTGLPAAAARRSSCGTRTARRGEQVGSLTYSAQKGKHGGRTAMGSFTRLPFWMAGSPI
jgi:hypothetical protein